MDLDHTILACDSFKFFLLHWFIKNKKIFLLYFIHFFLYYIFFKIGLINNKTVKQKFLQLAFSKSDKKQILKFSKNFAKIIIKKFIKKNAIKVLRQSYEKKILITASPDFYVKFISEFLKFDLFFSTKIDLDKKIGNIVGENCFGNEKLKIIKKLKLNKNQIYFYSDSLTDLPLMKYCKFSYLVKKNHFAKMSFV